MSAGWVTIDGWTDEHGVVHVADWCTKRTDCGKPIEGPLEPGGVRITCEDC